MNWIANYLSNSTGSGAANQLMDADHVGIIHGSLTRLFENAKFLDDAAFIAFTTALCRLSAEASGLPIGEEESSSVNKSARSVSQMNYLVSSVMTNQELFRKYSTRHHLQWKSCDILLFSI